jgi:hypothetical protein
MAKIQCFCGHIIADQTDNLPDKARYFADQDYHISFEKFIDYCAELIKAREEGRQKEFISHLFGEDYPQEGLDVSDFINDHLAGMLAVFGHFMHECAQCGRLWIQPDTFENKYVTYLPEGETRGVLVGKKKRDSQR